MASKHADPQGELRSAEKECDVDFLACPQCGSEWFTSTRTGERIAFQMETKRHPVIRDPDGISKEAAPIDPEHIFCGACTWQGAVSALVESR